VFSVLLGLCLLFLLYFGCYWGILLGFMWIQAYAQREALPPTDATDRGVVLALVPSHHEGEGVVDTVRTLVDQDYEGLLNIQVLVEDFTDSTVTALRKEYAENSSETKTVLSLQCNKPNRSVQVVAVGNRAKHAKINFALDRAEADFIAFLDADHRARKEWISDSVASITTHGVDGVQMRKMPLSTTSLAQTWDAGLSHVTFELFNQASQRSFGLVSFTGSTAVFTAESLRENRLADCITEDTYLSYDMLLQGRRIIYDRRIGSYEEVTPNIPSFVFRRRRWSAGHSHAFLAHLPGLLSNTASLPSRILILFMGQFFLMPLAIGGFFAMQGIYYFMLFTLQVRLMILILSAVLAFVLTMWLSWRRSTKVTDFLVVWATLLPHACMSGALVYLLAETETYYFITSFPYQGQLWSVQAILVLAAIVTYIISWERIRSVRIGAALVFVFTVPLMIFFDLLSALFGFSDLVLRRRQWSAIDRSNEISESVEASLRENLVTAKEGKTNRKRWIYAIGFVPMLGMCTVSVNDVMSIDQCGNVDPFLWQPIFTAKHAQPLLTVEIERKAIEDQMEVRVRAEVYPQANGPFTLQFYDGKEKVQEQKVPVSKTMQSLSTQLVWPLGWESRKVTVTLNGPGLSCRIARRLSTRIVTVNEEGMQVNGEPFVLKGMVPTFSAPGIGLGVHDGYAQLKQIGVNTVRIYHPPTPAIQQAAWDHEMFLIPQPDSSTWESVDPERRLDQGLYARRWRSLVRNTEGNPYVLMLNAGNELEIDDRSEDRIQGIQTLLKRASQVNHDFTTYSTFTTFIEYPVDILGINMLDSGPTYWSKALELVSSMERPFYASEFGGFVAFFESTPAMMRQWRMFQQSELLREKGALGTVFFASHDNWSQAVPPGGYNDPFTGDHPDDRRGYWDPNNQPKPELEMLRYLLADAQLSVKTTRVTPQTSELVIQVQNRRSYTLRDFQFNVGEADAWTVGDIAPNETHEIVVSTKSLRASPAYPNLLAQYSYVSHHGLEGGGQWVLPVPDPTSGPVVVGTPVFQMEHSADALSFTALIPGEAQVVVPDDWRKALVSGEVIDVQSGSIRLTLKEPIYPVSNLQTSEDGESWVPFDTQQIDTGDTFLRFDLPELPYSEQTLILSGLAASRVNFLWEDGKSSVYSHAYRETLVDISQRSGLALARFRRVRPSYLGAARTPTGEPVSIDLEEPFVFAPQQVEITRAD